MSHECKPHSDGWEGSSYECPDCGRDWLLDLSIVNGEHVYKWEP
jgi:transposase-like protein